MILKNSSIEITLYNLLTLEVNLLSGEERSASMLTCICLIDLYHYACV